jgi:rare lipoprotein A
MIKALLLLSLTLPAQARPVVGLASWYSQGTVTASGERFNPNHHTAAHRHLPLGTKLKVTNLRTQKSVQVRVNDRGPFIKGRVLDLSRGAAKAIQMAGIDKVRIDILWRPK